jgi:hypothetical protein
MFLRPDRIGVSVDRSWHLVDSLAERVDLDALSAVRNAGTTLDG